MTRYKPQAPAWFSRHIERLHRNAEAYTCVQKILQDGCSKKSAAVREAAKELGRGERSIWTSLREHERQLKSQADEERRIRIELGEEEPTEEEIEAARDQWIQHLIDLRRGK